MARHSIRMLALFLIPALLLGGCTWFRKRDQPAGAGANPPAGGPPGGPAPVTQAPPRVLQALRYGPLSPDRRWQAVVVAAGPAEEQGVWVASSDLKEIRRVSTAAHPYAGTARWTPWNTVLYALENSAHPNVTWFEYNPVTHTTQEFLPGFLKGKRALIGPDAFSPDGKQVVFSTGHCLCQNPPDQETIEVYLANVDGSGSPRHLGTNVVAAFVDGELLVTEMGK